MSNPDIPSHISIEEFGKGSSPAFRFPVLSLEQRRLAEPWQIVLHDTEDRRAYFTKWTEDGALEGLASPDDATQFDLKLGLLAGIQKAVELRDTQFNPDKLYIVDADRTLIALLTPED